ncbi:GINS complex, Sld5 component, partial [Saitoella complicata NRRL Y-17804]
MTDADLGFSLSDILADRPPASAPSSTADINALTQSFISERLSPELLPFETEVLDRVMGRVQDMIMRVEEAMSEQAEGHGGGGFKVVLMQTELERVKWLVRSYLRARLHKIDRYPLHILRTQDLVTRLSRTEKQYAQKHLALLTHHYRSSFLSALDPQLQNLDDNTAGISMIETPDLDSAVFVRVKRDVEGGDGDVLGVKTGAKGEGGEEEMVELRGGAIYILRWSAVRKWVVSGDVEL